MTQHTPLPRKALVGLGFWYLAGLGWTICLVAPLTPLPHKLAVSVAALAVAETSFLVGLALLGKTYYKRLKDKYMGFLRGKRK
jgi:hypothetical protein